MGVHSLPTAQQLGRLPLRAIAAYAARAARRAQTVLCGIIQENILEDAISIVEKTASLEKPDLPDAASAALANSHVMGAAISLKRPQEHHAVMSIHYATHTATLVLLVIQDLEKNRDREVRYAARAGQTAAKAAEGAVDALDQPMATAAASAAWKDYAALSKRFGEHDTVVVGEPIDLSDISFWGTLVPEA